MWRLILIVSILPLILALMARWWFGLRVLAQDGGRPCRCDLALWMPAPGDDALVHRAEGSAGDFGKQLWLKAMEEWAEADPSASRAREKIRRFGHAVPPLCGIVAVMGVIVAKIQVMGGIAAVLGATAVATLMDLASLPRELAAITRTAAKTKELKVFPNREDEAAVLRCAMAYAWRQALPAMLRMVQK